MARVGLVQDERFRRHDTGPGHPERPARLDAIRDALQGAGLLERTQALPVEPIDEELLLGVHTAEYLERLTRACERGLPWIDVPDSAICRESAAVARLAAGSVVAAAREIVSGRVQRAFCAVRPPGHHAEADRSMGFCLLANAVLATRWLQQRAGIERILILDWDVHHGNGTQHLLEDDPGTLFISLHGDPRFTYPGTGYAQERGRGAGEGFTLNIPLAPGSGDREYRQAFEQLVLPAAEGFAPQFIIVSAGFDAHRDDPLGNQELSDEAFEWMTQRTCELAGRWADGRVLSVLEGGYDLDALGRCAALHVRALLS